jgi:hypothetical protein
MLSLIKWYQWASVQFQSPPYFWALYFDSFILQISWVLLYFLIDYIARSFFGKALHLIRMLIEHNQVTKETLGKDKGLHCQLCLDTQGLILAMMTKISWYIGMIIIRGLHLKRDQSISNSNDWRVFRFMPLPDLMPTQQSQLFSFLSFSLMRLQ